VNLTTKKIHVRHDLQIMVRTRGLDHALGKDIGRALGRQDHIRQMMFPSNVGLPYPHVDNVKLSLLLRMFLR